MERPDHVLVVDDDAEIRKLLGEYLQRNGFRVSLANDGREMRRSLEQTRPDIVVLDLMLPGDSGLTLCRVRADSSLPVIMLTARQEVVASSSGDGADVVGKPFSPRQAPRIRASCSTSAAFRRRLASAMRFADGHSIRRRGN
jgi:two-component system OmpR family response regulator